MATGMENTVLKLLKNEIEQQQAIHDVFKNFQQYTDDDKLLTRSVYVKATHFNFLEQLRTMKVELELYIDQTKMPKSLNTKT